MILKVVVASVTLFTRLSDVTVIESALWVSGENVRALILASLLFGHGSGTGPVEVQVTEEHAVHKISLTVLADGAL